MDIKKLRVKEKEMKTNHNQLHRVLHAVTVLVLLGSDIAYAYLNLWN
jgi:hypothetical protein